jgi:hypothetical protein
VAEHSSVDGECIVANLEAVIAGAGESRETFLGEKGVARYDACSP